MKNLSWNKGVVSLVYGISHLLYANVLKYMYKILGIVIISQIMSEIYPKYLILQKGIIFLIGVYEYLKAYPNVVTLLSGLTFSTVFVEKQYFS